MDLFTEVNKLTCYLVKKKSELEDLHVKDVVMARAILDVHRRKARKDVVGVPSTICDGSVESTGYGE